MPPIMIPTSGRIDPAESGISMYACSSQTLNVTHVSIVCGDLCIARFALYAARLNSPQQCKMSQIDNA